MAERACVSLIPLKVRDLEFHRDLHNGDQAKFGSKLAEKILSSESFNS
jgi:hypothetical protein